MILQHGYVWAGWWDLTGKAGCCSLCSRGTAERRGWVRGKDISMHIHPQLLYIFTADQKTSQFPYLGRYSLKLLCILYSIYSTRLQSTSTVEGLMYPWKSFFWKAFRIFYFVLDTNVLETADWKFTSHECEDIGHSCGDEMAKPHCFMGCCHNRISRRGDNKIVVTV